LSFKYLVDTDVLIWYFRGNENARNLLKSINFSISLITYLELIQGVRNKEELREIQRFVREWSIDIIYLNSEISLRAQFLVEEFCLSHAMRFPDALIASTALNNGFILVSANDKHYKFINNLDLKIFRKS